MKKAHAVGLAFSFSEGIIFFAYAGIFYLGAYLVETKDLYFDDMFK
jgi:ATP-binding cassette subfamily B (MDR/TAP) protein 1